MKHLKYLLYTLILLLPINTWANPAIYIDGFVKDLGDVCGADKTSVVFTIQNIGSDDLIIENLATNCSCIFTSADNYYLMEGEYAKITITLDVKYLKGAVSKQVFVFTNDPKSPMTKLTINANVSDKYHGKGAQGVEKIFSNECADCHVKKGKGLTGKRLFFADCLYCHRVGGISAPLIDLRKVPIERLSPSIENGVSNTRMPAFLNTKGGPLTPEEIASLVEFLKNPKK